MTMILIYTSACTSGLAFHATGLTAEQDETIEKAVDAYNTTEAYNARGYDGTAYAHEDDDAVQEHNEERDPEDAVTDAASLIAWYAATDDGHGEAVTAARLTEVAEQGAWKALGYED